MRKVVHFEIPTDDMERAKKFYSGVFDWKLQDMGKDFGGYVLVSTVETDANQMPTEPGAINGGLMARKEKVKSPVLVIDVPSVDEYIKKVKDAGGTVVEAKTEIPGMGYYAYVTDSEGNIIGIFEYIKG